MATRDHCGAMRKDGSFVGMTTVAVLFCVLTLCSGVSGDFEDGIGWVSGGGGDALGPFHHQVTEDDIDGSMGDYDDADPGSITITKDAPIPRLVEPITTVVGVISFAAFVFCSQWSEARTFSLWTARYLILITQVIFLVVFALHGSNDSDNLYANIELKGDIRYMGMTLLVGFGFLTSFLRGYGKSAVGGSLLLLCLTLQWHTVLQHSIRLEPQRVVHMETSALVKSCSACLSLFVTLGALVGRTTLSQLFVVGFLEAFFYQVNSLVVSDVLEAVDAGGALTIHVFGAYFGLACSFVLLYSRSRYVPQPDHSATRLPHKWLASLGTTLLWVMWPLFTTVGTVQRERAVTTNTIALCSGAVVSLSLAVMEQSSVDLSATLSAALSGGVAVSSLSDILVNPGIAAALGLLAGLISHVGVTRISPWMSSSLQLHDTCGVHHVHGLNGIISSLASVVIISHANAQDLGADYVWLHRAEQPSIQIVALLSTIAISTISGAATGYVLRKHTRPQRESFQQEDWQ